MKHFRKNRWSPFVCLFTCLLLVIGEFLLSSASAQAAAAPKEVDIIFFHDTHSHLETFSTIENGERILSGGFAKIKTIIDKARETNPHTLVLDAGDFSMGTLAQTIYSTQASELRTLGAVGCDASTLGNHEFDYRSQGLADMLNAAKVSGDVLPELVLCNIDWETMEAEGLTEEQQLLKNAFETFGMKDYTILQKGDVKIALFGLFGKDSLACAPTCVLKFKEPVAAAAATVARIKAEEKPDLIICLSHSGTSQTPSKSEDEQLAAQVPDIDLIISGHSHTTLPQSIQCGDTYIGSTGEYARQIGTISLRQKENGRWEQTAYELVPVSADIPEDPEVQAKVADFFELVDATYLKDFGYTSRQQVLVQNPYVFSSTADLYKVHTEHTLGNLLSDAFRYAVNTFDTTDTHPVDIAIVPAGTVRETFPVGELTVEDIYNSYSLGIGPDGVAGYPLLSIYISGKDLKTAAEIDASISALMAGATLYPSGMNITFNPHRMILNKVTDCYLIDTEGNRVEFEDDRLYRVVCDLYTGQMLGNVTDLSFGLLSIQPRLADGTVVENAEDAIVYANGKELKAWAAIASYLDSMEDTDGDGIRNLSADYSAPQGRKIVEDDDGIWARIKNPNRFAVGIVVILIVVILLLILILRLLVKLIRWIVRRIRRKKA